MNSNAKAFNSLSGKIIHYSDEKIQFGALAGQVGVTADGVLILEEVLKSLARWLLGRPVVLGDMGSPVIVHSRTIGQVDEARYKHEND